MPVPKRAPARKLANNHLTSEQVAAAQVEAERQIAERERYMLAFDDAARYRNLLAKAHRTARARGADPALLRELGGEIERVEASMASLDHDLGSRAFDAETVEQATWRVLLERGANPTQIGRAWNPRKAPDELSQTSEKVLTQKLRDVLLRFYADLMQRLGEDLERARAGKVASKYVPLAAIVAKGEAAQARLEAVVAALAHRGR